MAQNLHTVRVYNKDRSTNLAKIKAYVSLSYEHSLNSHGVASMVMDILSAQSTEANLKKYNRISISKGSVEKWRGYIKDVRMDSQFNLKIEMADLAYFLKYKRFITKAYGSQSVVTIFEDIIDTMNAEYGTELTYGGTDILAPSSEEFDFNNTSVYEALQDVAKVVAGEVYIDSDDKVWLLSQVGSDKTSTVQFKFLQNRMNENNVSSPGVNEDGDRMVNYVKAKNDESVPKTSNKSDATSIGEYGRLERSITFYGIVSQNALDEAAQDYLDIYKDPIISPSFSPIASKISESLYTIGDLCKIKMSYGYISLNDNYRIIRKSMTVMKDGSNEKAMIEVGNTRITKDNFFLRFSDVEKRLADLEK